MGKLPARYDPNSGPIQHIDGSNNRSALDEKSLVSMNSAPPSNAPPSYGAPPSQPHEEIAEALYAYQPTGPTDLALYQGQRVRVLERLNNDWWRGQDINTQREGMFPSNYVRVTNGAEVQRTAPAPPVNNNYYPPPQQYNNNAYYPPQQQQQQFPPPSTNYYQPPPQQQQQVVEQPVQHSGGSGALAEGAKKVGGKLGNAAIFGAGATIGSNIVNSIF